MKVLHINTLSRGGAANAAIRLHLGLLDLGTESHFLTLSPLPRSIPNNIVFPQFSKYGFSLTKRIKNKIGIKRLEVARRIIDSKNNFEQIECFSSPNTDYKLAEFINNQLNVDIVNLHWVANFLDYDEFFRKIKKPVVWTLHDENPFSSYWHYSNDYIQTSEALKIHNEYLKAKINALAHSQEQIHIAAPSEWLCSESSKSKAFGTLLHHHIPYGIDTNIYKPTDSKPRALNFKKNESDIKGLFICQSIHNKRKGMHVLLEALKLIPESLNIKFIAIGKVDTTILDEFPKNIFFTGEISDEEELAKLYSYADFTIIPSLQDNLPNTMIESLCCGTPVLGTPAGGIPEVVGRSNNGLIATGFNPEDLAELIKSFVKQKSDFIREDIANNARREFNMDIQAKEYIRLYKSILS